MSRTRQTKKQSLYHDRVVRMYYEENVDKKKICDIFPVSFSTICKWISTFASTNPDKVREYMQKSKQKEEVVQSALQVSEQVQALQSEISRLRKELERETMRADLYNEIINVAEKKFDICIRKKAGTKQ